MHLSQTNVEFESRFLKEFTPIRILGQGGFGCVFEAQKHVMNRVTLWKNAVKRIPLPNDDQAIDNALREVSALFAMDHLGIVKLFDAWTEEPPPGWQFTYKNNSAFLYIQMELCKSTLAEWLGQNKDRDSVIMMKWFEQIVSAVAYIHKMKYIHRDLKPSNILFAVENHLKVADLGIVTNRTVIDGTEGQEVAAEHTAGIGTRMYMAPEQNGWDDYSSKVDIFALGLIYAEMNVAITEDGAEEAFDNYRTGEQNVMLRHLPVEEKLVGWMTKQADIDRPDCEQLLHFIGLADTSKFLLEYKPLRVYGRGPRGAVLDAKAKHLNSIGRTPSGRMQMVPVKVVRTDVNDDDLRNAHRCLGIKQLFSIDDLWTEDLRSGWKQWTRDWRLVELNREIQLFESDCSINSNDRLVFIPMQISYTLAQWLAKNETRDIIKMKKWFLQIVNLVSSIHKKDLFHGKLKPTNIFVREAEDEIELCCFALLERKAWEIKDERTKDSKEQEYYRDTEMHMAPEQIHNSCSSTKADIFSLGLIFIELLTQLTNDEAKKTFDECRAGCYDNIFPLLPEAAQFVRWITNVNCEERPTCEDILAHPFLNSESDAECNQTSTVDFDSHFNFDSLLMQIMCAKSNSPHIIKP